MKNWSLKSLFLIAGLGMFITSCTDDGGGTSTDLNPSVTFAIGSGVISADATVDVGAEFTVTVKGLKTTNDLKTLAVLEGGAKIDPNRVNLASNIIILTGTEVTTFTKDIKIKAHNSIGPVTYSFEVVDIKGSKGTASIVITTKGVPPTLVLNGTDNITVGLSSLFDIKLKVTKGTSKLKTVEVLENDVLITEVGRLSYGGNVTFTANPFTIPAADQDLFDSKIQVRSAATSGTYKYTYIFTDEAGQKTTQIINVTVGTLVIIKEAKLLSNQAGPAGKGGLDLDLGDSTGTGTDPLSLTAEIRDMGINANSTATNWKQQIAGMNGSEVKYIVKGANGVPETFSFANVSLNEEILGLWTKGSAFTKTDAGLSVSNKIDVGDVFIVKNGSKYYLINTKQVNVITTDNTDNYVFDIKY